MKDTYPSLTVGIPVFNGEKFIKSSVMSVLNQAYKDFELIVTDDGSTDETMDILRSIKDPRIRIVSDGENHGISYRLNQQINLARGKYFVRMDGDDLMMPDRLEKQLEFLEEHPKMDVCGGQAIVIDDNNMILGKRGNQNPPTSRNQMFFHTRFIHPTVMGKTEWFRKWKYDENMSGCEDMDLWIRSTHDSVWGDVSSPILFYRDPLKFKLQTFLKRQCKILRCCWIRRDYMKGTGVFFKRICKTITTGLAAIFVCLFRLDKEWISRRNSPMNLQDIDYYEQILATIV